MIAGSLVSLPLIASMDCFGPERIPFETSAPRHSPTIGVVFSGSSNRVPAGLALYDAGVVDTLLIVGTPKSSAKVYMNKRAKDRTDNKTGRRLRSDDGIIFDGYTNQDTLDDAQTAIQWLLKNATQPGVRYNVVIITAHWHSYRSNDAVHAGFLTTPGIGNNYRECYNICLYQLDDEPAKTARQWAKRHAEPFDRGGRRIWRAADYFIHHLNF